MPMSKAVVDRAKELDLTTALQQYNLSKQSLILAEKYSEFHKGVLMWKLRAEATATQVSTREVRPLENVVFNTTHIAMDTELYKVNLDERVSYTTSTSTYREELQGMIVLATQAGASQERISALQEALRLFDRSRTYYTVTSLKVKTL